MAPKSKKDTVWKLVRDEDYDGLIPKVFANHNEIAHSWDAIPQREPHVLILDAKIRRVAGTQNICALIVWIMRLWKRLQQGKCSKSMADAYAVETNHQHVYAEIISAKILFVKNVVFCFVIYV